MLGLARNIKMQLGSDWGVGESGTAQPTEEITITERRISCKQSYKVDCSGIVVLPVIGPGVELSKSVKSGLRNE